MKKIKLFYHGTDMDGYASGYIGKKFALSKQKNHEYDEFEMIPLVYGARELKLSDFVDLDKSDLVIISDWSLTDADAHILDYINSSNLDVIWCDHHDTSIALLNKYPNFKSIKGIRSKDYSGAYLLYQTLFPDQCIPYWLELVSDYDTFKLNIPDSMAFNYGVLNCGKHDPKFDTSIWTSLDSESKTKTEWALSKTIRHGSQILRFILADNKRYLLANGFECDLDGYRCIACNKISNSLLFNSVDKSNYDLLCAFVFDGNQYRYSIYSDDSINCAEIAAKYGGGGHKGAAGFRSKELILKNCKKLESYRG